MICINKFSPKQKLVMNWWCRTSPYYARDAIICDGAVRSGKTTCMALSFVFWANASFSGASFALCAKTLRSLRRNVVEPLKQVLESIGYQCIDRPSKDYLELTLDGRTNRFYLFGGNDEGAAARIQGVTLSGILLDEVALMPRSFVEQALARCSVHGSRFWFNCNPEHPYHWFYTEWIQKATQKNVLYLHFRMEDNPSLTTRIRRRYENLFSGVFYERFIEGKWVCATGLVYPMFDRNVHVYNQRKLYGKYYISCDYGTVNPMSMGLWGEHRGVWDRTAECYYDSRREQRLKTDEEYYEMLELLAGDRAIEAVIVDPSAASFMECIRRHGRYRVIPAKNDVRDGIRRVSDALRDQKIRIHESCLDTLREFTAYVWDESGHGDAPKKEHDHAMDDIRYFVNTVLYAQTEDFFVVSAARDTVS